MVALKTCLFHNLLHPSQRINSASMNYFALTNDPKATAFNNFSLSYHTSSNTATATAEYGPNFS